MLSRFPRLHCKGFCQGSQVTVSSFPRNRCKGTRGFQSRHLNGAKGPCDETKKGKRISPTARKKWPRSFCKNMVHAMDISCVRMYDSLRIISCTWYFIRMTLYAYVLYISVRRAGITPYLYFIRKTWWWSSYESKKSLSILSKNLDYNYTTSHNIIEQTKRKQRQ